MSELPLPRGFAAELMGFLRGVSELEGQPSDTTKQYAAYCSSRLEALLEAERDITKLKEEDTHAPPAR